MRAAICCVLLILLAVVRGDVAWSRGFLGTQDATYGLIRAGGDGLLKVQGTGTGMTPFIDAYDPDGNLKWHGYLPGPAKEIHAGADGRTYLCGPGGSQGAYVRCFDPSGKVAWTLFSNPDPDHGETFSSLRVEGDDMWVLGTRNTIRNGTSRPVAACLRLNRISGQVLFERTYPIWSDGSRDEFGLKVVRNDTSVFLLIGGNDFHSVVRINPISGSPIGRATFHSGPGLDVVVDSLSNLYVSGGPTASVAKVIGTGTGALPVPWSGVPGGTNLLLLKGSLWCIRNAAGSSGIRRIDANGGSDTLYVSPDSPGKFTSLVTERFGRLFVSQIWTDTFAIRWQNIKVDPTSGIGSIEPVTSAETAVTGGGLAVAADGTTYSCGREYGPLLYCSYRVPSPVADTFAVPSGKATTISAPGVMANDMDVDPLRCKTYLDFQASHGTVILNSNGSFRYTPATGFTGTDSFRYRVKRGVRQAIGTVTIHVQP